MEEAEARIRRKDAQLRQLWRVETACDEQLALGELVLGAHRQAAAAAREAEGGEAHRQLAASSPVFGELERLVAALEERRLATEAARREACLLACQASAAAVPQPDNSPSTKT